MGVKNKAQGPESTLQKLQSGPFALHCIFFYSFCYIDTTLK